ncbi:MAG: hypothetical protein ACSHX9_17290 [Luteolibacter sp.]
MKSISNVITIALIGGGVAAFVVSSRPLLENKEVDVPLNALGINRSPYGEVFAMAMQGPIDTFFHAAESNGHDCEDPENCQHEQIKENEDIAKVEYGSWNDRLRHFIEEMGAGQVERTNPRAASAAHKFYLRRQIEDKLRFAYNLDPSHYGNYNAYHFFLTQPQLGTRPELTPGAAKLAQDTINYCLNQRTDPRQALTAAAAAGNVIELMFNDRNLNPENPRYTTVQMREMLSIMDHSIGLYSHLSNEWLEKGYWENLSELRLSEASERFNFILKIRQSQEQAIRRLEGLPDTQRAANSETSR